MALLVATVLLVVAVLLVVVVVSASLQLQVAPPVGCLPPVVARLRVVAQGAQRTTLHPVGLGPRVAVVLAVQVAAARLVRARQRRRRQPGQVARGRAPVSPVRTK
ncbi:hypothetical protein QJQ45_001915 [Haematococcus lacustris]|nr:hypothetical protein QJQ45_001915 [Haematococcus lacustris]